eukprot:m.201275 g.201275  ORF g.201275 m.201275 type:complete len:70 (-) comp18799_c0_seq2:1575-1784(-)
MTCVSACVELAARRSAYALCMPFAPQRAIPVGKEKLLAVIMVTPHSEYFCLQNMKLLLSRSRILYLVVV